MELADATVNQHFADRCAKLIHLLGYSNGQNVLLLIYCFRCYSVSSVAKLRAINNCIHRNANTSNALSTCQTLPPPEFHSTIPTIRRQLCRWRNDTSTQLITLIYLPSVCLSKQNEAPRRGQTQAVQSTNCLTNWLTDWMTATIWTIDVRQAICRLLK